MEALEPLTTTTTITTTNNNNGDASTPDLQNPSTGETITANESNTLSEDIDSSCSTPYVSAPSSPGRGQPLGGFFYSAPASPMHFVLSMSNPNSMSPAATEVATSVTCSFEFEFSARSATNGNGSASTGSMSSADELFLNGQIRPMKLSTHLQRPQLLSPLLDLEETDGDCDDIMEDQEKLARGRDVKLRDRSLRRRTRSMSPLRTTSFQWHEDDDDDDERKSTQAHETDQSGLCFEDVESKQNVASSETTPSASASSSRSSSVGRSSKRWVFLKEFLYRSKSEGRNNGHKFWSSLSFSPVKDKKMATPTIPSNPITLKEKEKTTTTMESATAKVKREANKKAVGGKLMNGIGKRRMPPSAHELHYTANRAQAEEMRKKTFLPYKQGLLGCLGFSSKSYGAMNGFARALNPVSSR